MADKLVETGWAYPCFCTEEELIAKREQVRCRSRFSLAVMLRASTSAACSITPHGGASPRLSEGTFKRLASTGISETFAEQERISVV